MYNTQINSDEISILPFKAELASYSWDSFRHDFMAALSVALLTVPQAMAYALLAGLPLTAGLFAAIYSSMIAAIFGSSKHLIIGPSNAIAILIQLGTSEILFTYYRGLEGVERDILAMQILMELSLLVGIIQILAAFFKLGKLTQFVSHSVTIGYISGTVIAVVINQLFTFLGIDGMQGDHSLYEKTAYLFSHLGFTHWPTAVVGLVSLLMIIVLRRIDNRIPATIISLTFAAGVIHILNHYHYGMIATEETMQAQWGSVLLVQDRGYLDTLFPTFTMPSLDLSLINHLLPVAFAVSLLSIMETTSVSKSIAASSGQRLSTNQEIFGLGLANLFSSLISAVPISGSSSRTGFNYSLGAKTRFAAVLSALSVIVVLYSLSFLIMRIPLAALSALLLLTSVNIVNPRQFFVCLKATNSDAFVLWTTLISCLFFSLDVAFYIGIIISITFYLKKSAVPQLIEYDIDEEGELQSLDYARLHEHKPIRVIKVEGELFFGAADIFQTTLKTIAEDDTSTKVIILQLKNTRDIDATVCLAIQQLYDYLINSGRYLVACGMTQQVWDVLSDSGLVEQIGKENLFIFDERHPHLHMLKALKHARELASLPSLSLKEGIKDVGVEIITDQPKIEERGVKA